MVVIRSQSEHLSPRTGNESWHKEHPFRKGISKLWPTGQVQLFVYVKFYRNTDSSDHGLGTVYGCFYVQSWAAATGTIYIYPAKPQVFIMWLFAEKVCDPWSKTTCS